MKKIFKKSVIMFMSITVIMVASSVSVHADVDVPNMKTSSLPTSYTEANGEQSLDNMLNTVANNIDINTKDQTIDIEDSTQLADSISQNDVDNINFLSASEGLPANLTKQSIVSTFSSHINTLNNELHSGKYTVQSNGELVNSSDSNFYVQGGVTKDIIYWWGKKRYKSTYATNLWIDKLNSAAALNAGAASVAGIVLSGVVANITWALTYTIRKQ